MHLRLSFKERVRHAAKKRSSHNLISLSTFFVKARLLFAGVCMVERVRLGVGRRPHANRVKTCSVSIVLEIFSEQRRAQLEMGRESFELSSFGVYLCCAL